MLDDIHITRYVPNIDWFQEESIVVLPDAKCQTPTRPLQKCQTHFLICVISLVSTSFSGLSLTGLGIFGLGSSR